MPCRSDYMEPTAREKESLKVIRFLEELGEQVGDYDSVYGNPRRLDEDTAKLCSKCQETDISSYSLEMQIWWRDHQEADKRRIQREYEIEKERGEKDKALAKLTPYERKLLGL